MSSIKRTIGLSGLLGVAAALALAIPVKATPAGPLKGDCVVQGEAKANVNVMGGKGTFSFSSVTLTCAYVDPKTGQPAMGSGTVLASGQFKNIVCGTGKAVGTVTGTTGDPKFARLVGQKFAVEFAATAGAFYWHSWLKGGPAPVNEKLDIGGQTGKIISMSKNWQLAGALNLTAPTSKPVDPPTGALCTKAFTVTGTVAVDH